ncbi:sigma-70 family RNA polymerase sigma factor [Chitinophaga filiformis]|uniref:sigma-70 family RNA polymerase sigma factor n=1 Tax=Chitinophaga filiformis TaxID=104663 RepID=UPI001F1A4A56|nr:sigma-70 family RNA polymerase sigma factor [Chitinophaga filiformis]MCF6407576.1 sigma-70 family RNA polymerase sigma factor [Chitinophaga filiformis]MCF6407719.1 sigma-70 family RNA polymerase sigma factor [Chitinophaga filiformis]
MSEDQAHLSFSLQQRSRLHGLAYKMTESVTDAEDILSDVYISFSRQPFDQIREPERYLVRSVIHACFAILEKRKNVVYPGINLPEPLAYDRFPDLQKNDISYALLVLLQKLNAVERAVFLLRESFDYDYDEVASLIGISEANCRQHLHRAKEKLKTGNARYSPTSLEREEMTKAFLLACLNGDVKQLETYLSKEITLFMDGGGKAATATKPIAGFENVMLYLTRGAIKFGANISYTIKAVNMETGVLFENTLTADLDTVLIPVFNQDGQISQLFGIRNPDKMKYLT